MSGRKSPSPPSRARGSKRGDDEKWARDFRAKGFRMIAYGVDALLMQGALADGIKLLQGTVEKQGGGRRPGANGLGSSPTAQQMSNLSVRYIDTRFQC
jgi:hypothetical protein